MFVWYGVHTDMRLLFQTMKLEWVPPFKCFRRTKLRSLRTKVLKLQDQKCISAYLFNLGLDDQDPAQWGDAELSHLVVPEADYASDSEEEEGDEEEEEGQQRGGGATVAADLSHLVVPNLDYASVVASHR